MNSKMRKQIQAAPLMQAAGHHAKTALVLAMQAVDDVLHEDGASLDHPELVVGFLVAAGQAYSALMLRDGLEEVVEAVRDRGDGEVLQ